MVGQVHFARLSQSVVVVTLSVMLAHCDRNRATEAEPVAPEVVQTPTVVVTPLAPPSPLGRDALIAGLAQSASDYAKGSANVGTDPLVGRSFSLKLAFGCFGPGPVEDAPDGLAHWTWGDERRTLRLAMTPGDWIDSPLVAGAVVGDTGPSPDTAWEAVEGFWIARPWMGGEACPSRAFPQVGGAPLSPQTVGIVAVFPKDGSRLDRRAGRAYRHTIRADGDTAPAVPSSGFALRLEGRITAFPGGRATRCVSDHPDRRPTCVVAVSLDRVAFETAETGTVLAEWAGS